MAVHHLDVGWRPADMRLEDQLLKYFPAEIEAQQSRNRGYEADIRTVEAHPLPEEGFVGMEIGGRHYAEKADAGDAILALCKEIKSTEGIPIGSYRGFAMELSYDTFEKQFQITLKGGMSHRVSLGMDARGNLTRLDNALAGIPAAWNGAGAVGEPPQPAGRRTGGIGKTVPAGGGACRKEREARGTGCRPQYGRRSLPGW